MLSSLSASSYAARSSLIMCGLSALSASGRLSVIVALCPSTSYLMSDSFHVTFSPNSGVRFSPERRQAFFEIGCPAGQLHIEELLRHGLVKRGVLAVS